MVIAMFRFFRSLAFCVASVSVFVLPSVGQRSPAPTAQLVTEYNWSISPSEALGQPGNKTASLAACPQGVKGNEPEYWILINGSEAAKVTGGTCAGDGRPGTLQFVTQRTHPHGETLSSASGGLQESIVAARFTPTNPTVGFQFRIRMRSQKHLEALPTRILVSVNLSGGEEPLFALRQLKSWICMMPKRNRDVREERRGPSTAGLLRFAKQPLRSG